MKLLEWIQSFFSGESKENTPEGYCPNCWGRQEYGGTFIKAMDQEKIDLKNLSMKRGWITAYAEKNLEGIKLSDKNGKKSCPSCTK